MVSEDAAMTEQPQRKSRWWRRHMRFSVRGMALLVLIVGGGSGWYVRSAREQFAAVKAIERAGGDVSYAWDWKDGKHLPRGAPKWSKWISKHIGIDYLASVTDFGQ
jgi:hypothetical protein